MATSASGVSPLSAALQSLGVQRPAPAPKIDPKAAVEDMARQTGAPANVLMALSEADGGDLDQVRRNADFLGKRLAGGAKLDDAVSELAGDPARGAALMNRSYDIADQLYPEPAAPEAKPGIGTDLADTGKAITAGAINATGGAIQSLGAFADDAMRQGARREIAASGGDPTQIDGESIIRSGTRAAADAVRGAGGQVLGAISERGREAMQGFEPGGDLRDPSSWTLGDDPSIRGAVLQTAQGLGSMIPVVAASAVAGPAGGAVMGGLSAAGEGAQAGRDLVQAARGREGEAGPAAIEAMPGFRALLDQGLSPDEAAAELARHAESEAAARQAIPGTLGGAATGKILSRAEGFLNAGGTLSRAGKKAIAGALEEGSQEAAEGVASQSGIAAATGTGQDLGKDSFSNFVLGAMSGGLMGAGAGLVSPGETDSEQAGETRQSPADDSEAGGVPLLPAPTSGGTIFGASEARQEPGSFERDPRNPRRPRADQSAGGAQFRPAEPMSAADAGLDPAAEAERIFRAQPDTMDLPGDTPVPAEIDGEFTDIPLISDTSPDGSGAGAVAVPGGAASLSGAPGAAATNQAASATTAGPVERLAQGIAAATPPALPAPPVRFPEQKPGGAIQLGDEASGQIINGVFIGETDDGARVRVQGREIDLTPEQFDALRDAVPRIEDARKRAEKEAKAAGKALPAPQQEIQTDVEPGIPGQAPGVASDDTSLRVDDAGAGGGEGSSPGQGAEREGRQEGQGMARPGVPAGGEGQRSGSGHLGGLDVADDAGQLRGSLTDPDQAVDVSENPLREQQTGLASADRQQDRKAWPWRGKAMNAKTRGRAISDYFTPGNIVESYGGGRDRVVSFDPKAGAVTVEAVGQRGDEWVPTGERRTHATLPEDRALRRGPVARAPSPIDAAAAEANPEPTEAQKEAGNYRKGHVRWQGLDLSIENAKGSERRGTGPDGTEWSVTVPAHYGYFRGTEASDGDHVDFYMGDNPDAANAYVIDQVDAETGAYDEAKVMLGFESSAAARAAHESAFSDGKGAARLGGIKKMPIADLKTWLTSDATKKPVSMRARRAAAQKPAPAPQKRPLIAYVTQQLRGINPTGKVAEELRHRGVNARTAPGLWRRSGRKELDNIPASDHPDLEALVGRADDGLYLDPGRIIEAIVEEVAGRPQPIGEQAVLQQQARSNEEAADHARQQEAVYEIVPPGDDPRPAEERASSIEGTVDAFLQEYAPGHLTESERVDMIESLVKDGGHIDLAIYDAIMRRPLHDSGTAESEISGVPFGDAGSGERSEPERSREGGSEPSSDDSGRPAAERGGSEEEGERYDVTRELGADTKFSRSSSPVVEAGARSERDFDGARYESAMRSKPYGLDDNPAELNLDFADPEINPVPTSALRGLANSVSAILRQHGLEGRISARIVRVLLTASGVPVHGSYRNGEINVSAGARDAAHTARHEIIHALRDPALWGRSHGLFTPEEWRALVRAARGNPALRQAVEAAYPDLSTPGQAEEMVAEMYADWARDRDANPSGPVRAALARIVSFFRAMAAALRGEGFADAAQVMERIASGEIGGRGPDGGGSGEKGDGEVKHQSVQTAPVQIDPETAVPVVVLDGPVPETVDWRGEREWLRENLQGKEFTASDGVPVRISGISKKLTSSNTGNPIKQAAIRSLPRLIENAVVYSREADDKGRDNLSYAYAAIVARIDGEDYSVSLSYRVDGEGKRAAYQLLGYEMEKRSGGSSGDLAEASSAQPTPERLHTIADVVADFNRGNPPLFQRDLSALKEGLSRSKGRARGMIGNLHWKNAPDFFSSLLTDSMGKYDSMNILSFVPGNPLFEELGKAMPAAQKYLREKQAMDAWRNDWQARAAAVVDGWTRRARKSPEANDRLMDLMHASTIAGVDPSREGSWRRAVDDEARRALKQPNLSSERQEWAEGVIRAANDRERMWQRLKADFDALPAEFRDLYQQVRDEYAAMADEQDAALMSNIRTASKIAVKRADREHRKELQRISDEGLTGEERAAALEKANKRKTDAHARAARGGGARLQQLRQMFESNRLEGPYFPLARFGNYFVTIRDSDGKVTSFSRFQTEREQRAWINAATERDLGKVEHGVLGGDANLKGKVDPTFVAEVESLLADAGASDAMMDAVWQRWLETLPDQSVRTNRIHRKGRLGFNKDATRAFSSAMFHGAHQTARLRHGLEMEDALDDAEDQAKHEPNPNRAGFVVREMRQRHAFTMSPTNNPLVSAASGLAFVWYLGMSPASAIVNLSQTTIVGIPVMAARFRRAGVGGTTAELARALRDFGAGRGWSEKSNRLSADEKAAMKAGYDRGVIDKTQSHDLAAVAESGMEYNPTREKVMRVIGWGFHHTERMNREVTFLAAYRMARAEGMGQAEAVDEASRQVWKVHFDYQNTSRPRVMQSDMGKILTTFRNFTVNMLYRLFRDAHQSFAGADAETRREARAQLIGITLSMFAHAGIKGVWGFGLLSMLLGAFLPGDDDDFENWLQDALLIEGDGPGVAAWNWTMGMALNGVPGTVLDVDLTGRIGMADLWFRGSQKDLEGKDLWAYYLEQLAGPVAGIGSSAATGLSMLADGEWQRGAEKMVPKFASSVIKSSRYVGDGVTTYNGDPILDSVNPYEALATAMGFTPARIAERYRANNWLKNQEQKLMSERKAIMSDIGKSISGGAGITPDLAGQVRDWNAQYPFYPITADGLRQSMASRARMSSQNVGGIALNPKLDRHLREQVAPGSR